MLDDLKSFFTNSSVAEVGVGVTIGAAFAAVVAAATETVQSLFSGGLEYDGLLRALVVLLSVALLSLFGVVKPLMSLKERMTRVQADKVQEAVDSARAGDLSGAASAARAAVGRGEGADEPEPQPPAEPDALAAGAGADPVSELPLGGDPLTGEPVGPPPVAPVDPMTVEAAVDPLTGEPAGTQPIGTGDPLTDPLPLVQAQTVAHDPVQDPPASAPAGRAAAGLPHTALATKTCPFCAFEIPAVATRCGWCTSDLGDLERADDPVRVEA